MLWKGTGRRHIEVIELKWTVNDKGFLPLIFGIPTALVVLLVIILALLIGPPILFEFVPELKLLFQIFAAVIILNWVRNTLGPGNLSLVVACILIFIFVIAYTWMGWGIWVIYILLSFGLWSMIFWGLPLIFRK